MISFNAVHAEWKYSRAKLGIYSDLSNSARASHSAHAFELLFWYSDRVMRLRHYGPLNILPIDKGSPINVIIKRLKSKRTTVFANRMRVFFNLSFQTQIQRCFRWGVHFSYWRTFSRAWQRPLKRVFAEINKMALIPTRWNHHTYKLASVKPRYITHMYMHGQCNSVHVAMCTCA